MAAMSRALASNWSRRPAERRTRCHRRPRNSRRHRGSRSPCGAPAESWPLPRGPRDRAHRALSDRRQRWLCRPPRRPDRPRPARREYWRHRFSHWRPTATHADRPACRARLTRPRCFVGTPLAAMTIVALPPEDLTSRGSQPSRPRPLTITSLGVRDRLRVGRRRRIDMRVAVRADQRRDVDAVAADLLGEIAEDREARDDVEWSAAFARMREQLRMPSQRPKH